MRKLLVLMAMATALLWPVGAHAGLTMRRGHLAAVHYEQHFWGKGNYAYLLHPRGCWREDRKTVVCRFALHGEGHFATGRKLLVTYLIEVEVRKHHRHLWIWTREGG